MCDPIVVTLLKMRPLDSQTNKQSAVINITRQRSYATASSGTSPLAFYKDVPPTPNPLSPGAKPII